MKILAEYDYKLPTPLIASIEYGSFDGLEDNEIEAIEAFYNVLNDLKNENNGTSYTIEYSEEHNFGLFEHPFTSIAQAGDVTESKVFILGEENGIHAV